MSDIDPIIAPGVAFLNKIDPSWPNLINLDELDMRDPELCVIGQTFCHQLMREKAEIPFVGERAWVAGSWALDQYDENLAPWSAGFDSSSSVTYDELQRSWTEYIAERQGADR